MSEQHTAGAEVPSSEIRVDIWTDIACPWCYIGTHRFEHGLAQFAQQNPDVEVTVEHHSYELAPDTPEKFSGSEIDFLTTHKGMPRAQVEQMLSQMTELAASEGLVFDFERLRHVNTGRLHRVLHLAKGRGLYAELQDRLFRAYFSEGRDLSDVATLAGLGEEVGLAAEDVREAFADETFGAAVDADITRARMLGVNGVPFFLVDEKYGISGAQTADVIAGALKQVLELRESGRAA